MLKDYLRNIIISIKDKEAFVQTNACNLKQIKILISIAYQKVI